MDRPTDGHQASSSSILANTYADAHKRMGLSQTREALKVGKKWSLHNLISKSIVASACLSLAHQNAIASDFRVD